MTAKEGKKLVLQYLKKGVFKEDAGAVIADLKEDGLGVFVLLTKEGYPLYSAKDLGLMKIKFDKYELDRSINVVGKEQEHYFRQLFKTIEKMGLDKAVKASHHLVYELVMLPEGKMSSREGTMVLYEDLKQRLLEIVKHEITKRHDGWKEAEVNAAAFQIVMSAIKFSMLKRENNRVITFDWDEALNTEGDSGPYLQYAVVRSNSILEKADFKPKVSSDGHNDDEKRLIKKLAEFPELVERAAKDLSPHYLAGYLLELASLFNKFYTTSPVLKAEDAKIMANRLAIVKATQTVLKTGLELLGIECPEKM